MRSRCGRSRPTLGRSDLTSERCGTGAVSPDPMKAARPPGLQNGKRALRHVAADGVEHRVAARNHLREILGVVVDGLVGAEALHVVVVRLARRRDDARADVLCDLYREARDAARPALDQYRFAGFQLQRVLDGHQRGKPDQRQGRAFHVRKVVGLFRDDRRLDGNLFRVGRLVARFDYAEYRIADLQIVYAAAERADDARNIPPRDIGEGRGRPVFPRAHLPVRPVHAGGVHVDEHLAGFRHRVGHIAVLHDFRPAVFHEVGCFHLVSAKAVRRAAILARRGGAPASRPACCTTISFLQILQRPYSAAPRLRAGTTARRRAQTDARGRLRRGHATRETDPSTGTRSSLSRHGGSGHCPNNHQRGSNPHGDESGHRWVEVLALP